VGIFRRKRPDRDTYVPPEPEPLNDSIVEEATAELEAVIAHDEEIDDARARLLKIHRDNALGPRFWAAMGERRA
jgi:hypothetical protein